MSQYAHLSKPDPEWEQLASKLPPPPVPRPPVAERRSMVNQMVQTQNELWDPPYPQSGFKITESIIPVEDGSIKVRTYVPEGKADENEFPLLVWYHGGGFMIGDLELDDSLLRIICLNQRVSCVNVDYRLAPEYPFPIPVDDCYRATKWAAENAGALSADLSKGFMVGGASAGGNLAAVIALKARDDPSFTAKISGQILQVPYVCPSSVYPEKWREELLSAEQNKDAPLLTWESMIDILENYAPPELTDPNLAPLLASSHANLPAAYLQVCGLDLLRDEGFLYEKVLRESGVPTKLDVYPGQPHGFNLIAPQMKQSKKWVDDVQKGVEWLLQAR